MFQHPYLPDGCTTDHVDRSAEGEPPTPDDGVTAPTHWVVTDADRRGIYGAGYSRESALVEPLEYDPDAEYEAIPCNAALYRAATTAPWTAYSWVVRDGVAVIDEEPDDDIRY